MSRRGVDAAIRFGRGKWGAVETHKILDETIFPVASAQYHDGALPTEPRDLSKCALLANRWQPWEPWFKQFDLPWKASYVTMEIDDSGLSCKRPRTGWVYPSRAGSGSAGNLDRTP